MSSSSFFPLPKCAAGRKRKKRDPKAKAVTLMPGRERRGKTKPTPGIQNTERRIEKEEERFREEEKDGNERR